MPIRRIAAEPKHRGQLAQGVGLKVDIFRLRCHVRGLFGKVAGLGDVAAPGHDRRTDGAPHHLHFHVVLGRGRFGRVQQQRGVAVAALIADHER